MIEKDGQVCVIIHLIEIITKLSNTGICVQVLRVYTCDYTHGDQVCSNKNMNVNLKTCLWLTCILTLVYIRT